ncbi:ArsR/SmtB family transcription factor [Pseudalkalibacillus hwajinpoensis]|uniref:ArsR/SmtB family transcription factor n=1 Tax=Guptibacillus hwajinpoensis TaxID=208199 RepID=UPI001CD31F17|nr:winged helix-turn-helix domain-containing protein [Pseudalkalibacillus hwajinpoensis]MCA0993321.1 winged helix-turn-helix domain-containing protein [Pseudalkalibacillus hwajinpoensis]
MSYNISVLASTVYELLLSFSLYKRQTLMKYLDLGSKWPGEVEESLSPELKQAIASKENLFFEDLLVLFIEQSPYKHDIDSFFEWLGNMSAGELFERIASSLDDQRAIPTNLLAQRDQSIKLLKEWNTQYFQDHREGVLERLTADAESKQKMLEEDSGEEVILQASRFVVESKTVQNVCLIPSLHIQPMALIDHLKDTLYISYSVKDPKKERNELLRFTKALGDEKRLKILEFLSQESHTFTDIVSEIGMAKGNIHHHLSILRGAGLVNLHIRDERNTFYYSANKEIAEEFRMLVDQLL